jgi:type I restriction enzyme S subunit
MILKSQRKEIVGLLEKNDDTLPAGWKVVELGSVLAAQPDGKLVHQGWSPQCDREPAGEDEWGVLKTTAIQDGYFLEYENKRLPLNKEPRERIEVRDGDLLLTNAGPRKRCGVICYVREVRKKLMLSGKMYRLRFPDGEIYPKYMEFWLRTSSTQNEINDRKTGINESGLNLTQARFLTLPVMLLPIAEQKIIAEKLDTLLAQVDTTKARLERIPDIIKRFRQSVLAAAVSGKLTEEWTDATTYNYYDRIDSKINKQLKKKGDHNLSDKELTLANSLFDSPKWERWRLYPLEALVDSDRGIPYGIVQTGENVIDGVRTIRCGDVKPLSVDTSSLKLVSQDIEEKYRRTRLQGNEVILAIRGTVGNAAVITQDLVEKPLNISREVAMVPLKEGISSSYVAMLLQSPGGYRCLAEKTRGVAQRGINLADVKRFVTPLPSIEEQIEIVRRVEELFAFADIIEQKTNAALERVNNLTQSILAKAFRGELTADWRAANPDLISGENSAEALLAKIQAEREKLALEKKAAKKPRKKT